MAKDNNYEGKMNILVLGGGGFIGSAIVDKLLENGFSVRVFERQGILPYRVFLRSESIEWITGDWQNHYDLSNALENIDVVIHLISTTVPKSSNDDLIYDIQSNVIPTLQMLELAKLKKTKKIIFISSGGTVYGTPQYIPIDEKHPTNPIVSYGISKLTIEKYLLMFEKLYGIQSKILRVSNPYGRRQNPEKAQGAIDVFLYKALKNEKITIWGDGEIIRDYIYIDDVADAFIKTLKYTGQERIFNIGAGQGVSLNELIKKIELVLGNKIQKEYLAGRSFDVPKNILDISLAKKELNWSPTINTEKGLANTVIWMKDKIFKKEIK